MIFHKQPVSNVPPVPVNGKRFTLKSVKNYQRNEFFGKLIGPIVIGTVGGNGREIVGLMIGPYKMICRSF
jgi:hypothetical protein